MTEEIWSVEVQKVIMPFANAISPNVQRLDPIFTSHKAVWDAPSSLYAEFNYTS